MKPDGEHCPRIEWNLFYWILGTLCAPIVIPLILMHFLKKIKESKYRNCLPGKVVVITGASSGLGESLAHTFYKAGCKVVLTARRQSELERVKDELISMHTTTPTYLPIVIPLDLSELNSLPLAVKRILDIHGRIDILINNGGISVRSDVASSDIDVDIKIMLVNYFGSVAMTKAALPSMIERQDGRIVFISSVQGKFGLPFRSAYSASKHALQAFSDCLRAEIAAKGIKVTCISPGYIKTALSVNALTADGTVYGKFDIANATGVHPNSMANDILLCILRDEKDVILSQIQGRAAYWLRFICPPLYFWIMEKSAILDMSQYTPKERAEIVTLYIENNRSVVKTVRAYRKKYGRHSAPAENTIRSLAKNFFEYGSVATRQRPIRPRPKRSGEIIEAVKDSVATNDVTIGTKRKATEDGVGNGFPKIKKISDDQINRETIDQLISNNAIGTLSVKQLKLYLQQNAVKVTSTATKSVLIEKSLSYTLKLNNNLI